MIRLTLTPGALTGVRRLAHIHADISIIIHNNRRSISASISRGFGRNFSSQRSGAGPTWAPLRPSTIVSRVKLGYPGRRPILVRSGNYRATFVQPGHPQHYSFLTKTGFGVALEEGSEDARVTQLEGGTDRIIGRPVTILSAASEDELGNALDFVFDQWARQIGL